LHACKLSGALFLLSFLPADHVQFIDREYAIVNQRFLDDVETESASIDKSIAQRDREHQENPVLPEGRAHVGYVCRHSRSWRKTSTNAVVKDSLFLIYANRLSCPDRSDEILNPDRVAQQRLLVTHTPQRMSRSGIALNRRNSI
jgi:hypothetical protein